MVILESGGVGIGTSSPENKLHIFAGESGGAASLGLATIEDDTHAYLQFLTPSSKEQGVLFGDSDNNVGSITYSHVTDALMFTANAAERMRIDSSGNVGIGTSSPNSVIHLLGAENGEGASVGQVRIQSSTVFGSSPKAGIVFTNEHTTGSQAIMGGIYVGKDTTANGNYSGHMAFSTRKHGAVSVERMRISSAGNVGIGESSPVAKAHIQGSGTSGQVTASFILENSSSGTAGMDITGSAGASRLRFLYGGGPGTGTNSLTEAMCMLTEGAAAGDVLVGKTGSDFGTVGFELKATDTVWLTRSAGPPLSANRIGSSAGAAIVMYYNSSDVGSIDVAASSTSYNTSSDYRLKENVDYTWDATTRLKQLKPARFNFIVDETNTLVDGFLAHEVSSIVPEAISGTKDAMTTEVLYVEGDELPEGVSVGDVKEASVPDMQGIDQSKLVPLLVKAMQEQQATIEALEARLTALEG